MYSLMVKCIYSEVYVIKYGKDAAPSQAKFMLLWMNMFALLLNRGIIHSPFAQQFAHHLLFLVCTRHHSIYSR